MSTIQCKGCGKRIIQKGEKCPHCGKPIPLNTSTLLRPNISKNKKKIITPDLIPCITCGKDISKNALNCPHCKASQGKVNPEKTNQETPRNNMTKCKTCGESISKNAKICPHCGEPLIDAKPKEKKTSIWIWLVLLLFIGYVVDGAGEKSKKNNSTSNASSKYTTQSTSRKNGGCSVGDFTIKKGTGRLEGEYYKIPFSVTNNCSKSSGVKIQMSLYGRDNTLLRTMTGWPASVSNIPSGETYNDEWLKRVNQDVYRVTFKAVDVKVWR